MTIALVPHKDSGLGKPTTKKKTGMAARVQRCASAWNGLSTLEQVGITVGSGLVLMGVAELARRAWVGCPVAAPLTGPEAPSPGLTGRGGVTPTPVPLPVIRPTPREIVALTGPAADGWIAGWEAQLGHEGAALPPPAGHDAAWNDGWAQGARARLDYDAGKLAGYIQQGLNPMALPPARTTAPATASPAYARGWDDGTSLVYSLAATVFGADRPDVLDGLRVGFTAELAALRAGTAEPAPPAFDATTTTPAGSGVMTPTPPSLRSIHQHRGWRDGVQLAKDYQAGRVTLGDAMLSLTQGLGTYRL